MKSKDRDALLKALKLRFEKHMHRHAGITWAEVQARLDAHPDALRSLERMEATGGEPDAIGRADAAFVKARTGFSIGGVAPLAHTTPPVLLIDRALLRFESVWAAAGHPHAVFELAPQDLVALTGAPLADVVAL